MQPMKGETLGIILGIAAIVLMYPVGLLINLTTPTIQLWIATRTRTSLGNRIALLEAELKALEEFPAIEEVQDETLWEIRRTQLIVMAAACLVVLAIADLVVISTPLSLSSLAELNTGIAFIVAGDGIMIWLMRNRHDFRWKRSPKTRARYRKAIADLKAIRDSWPAN